MEKISINILKSLILRDVYDFVNCTIDSYTVDIRLNCTYIIVDVAKDNTEFTFSYNFNSELIPEKHLELFREQFNKFKDFITDL